MLDAVSRETRERLDIYVAELLRWQKAVNLVAKSTLDDVWTRHIADSLQIGHLAPAARSWVDLGSGGGLPGLVIAAEDPTRDVTLVESDGRKCAFLRHASHAMGLKTTVLEARIEVVTLDRVDVVTSRALASLPVLLGYAEKPLLAGATGLFLKGMDLARELTLARECWIFDSAIVPSRTDSTGRILQITNFEGRRS